MKIKENILGIGYGNYAIKFYNHKDLDIIIDYINDIYYNKMKKSLNRIRISIKKRSESGWFYIKGATLHIDDVEFGWDFLRVNPDFYSQNYKKIDFKIVMRKEKLKGV